MLVGICVSQNTNQIIYIQIVIQLTICIISPTCISEHIPIISPFGNLLLPNSGGLRFLRFGISYYAIEFSHTLSSRIVFLSLTLNDFKRCFRATGLRLGVSNRDGGSPTINYLRQIEHHPGRLIEGGRVCGILANQHRPGNIVAINFFGSSRDFAILRGAGRLINTLDQHRAAIFGISNCRIYGCIDILVRKITVDHVLIHTTENKLVIPCGIFNSHYVLPPSYSS
nr:MAG TPA: hypothetical protein [Caudoviricetes sp.]